MTTEANTAPIDRRFIEKTVQQARKSRINRVYNEDCFNSYDIKKSGVLQPKELTALDRVSLDNDQNESIHLFAFDQSGSYFDLTLRIVNFYPNGITNKESSFRLADVRIELGVKSLSIDDTDGNEKWTRYSYQTEQLLDYEEKRRQSTKHENRNVYRLGSLSIETVSPFSFTRILFNGMMKKHNSSDQDHHVLLPMRLCVSTHPNCDKFDFSYKFDTQYTSDIIFESIKNDKNTGDGKRIAKRLLELVREDRFDQPLMFQCRLLDLNDTDNGSKEQQFFMWGGKSKKFLKTQMDSTLKGSRENLFVWAESAQQFHLCRPLDKWPHLVYGLVHNAFEYASYLYACSLKREKSDSTKEELTFGQLKSFVQLTREHRITFRGFVKKDYTLELVEDAKEFLPFRIKLNGFDGWALRRVENLGDRLLEAQTRLWQMRIDASPISYNLSQESLLGGKANSLIQMAKITQSQELGLINQVKVDENCSVTVTVPKGIVLSCLAYKTWLESDPKLLQAICRLDSTRCSLAAKSVHMNPLSDKFVSLAVIQKTLKDECQKTGEVLRSCPLPTHLQDYLKCNLVQLFGESAIVSENIADLKQFAVRSSAVGEDSLETSAAGQMRTLLHVQGLESICSAVVDCWSSQFELEAVTYKTQNGLEFDLPMSVVVQELVECQLAGVAATCNPLNGNKSQLEITANRGLGESVVAGKQTDTIKIELSSLEWDEELEQYKGELSLSKHSNRISKPAECCLSDEQIMALGNLLLQLRQKSGLIRDREIEWAITCEECPSGDVAIGSQSSQSSSSVSTDELGKFRIHLLQSRPLTHLQLLDTKEIDHQLDYGFSTPIDQVTRANAGEVMPGAMCALNTSYFHPAVSSLGSRKPYEENHTRKVFVFESFAYFAQMAVIVLSQSETIKRFQAPKKEEENGKESSGVLQTMLGARNNTIENEESVDRIGRFYREKANPLGVGSSRSLGTLIMLDTVEYQYHKMKGYYHDGKVHLSEDLISIDKLELLCESTAEVGALEKFRSMVEQQVEILWSRMCTQTAPLIISWRCHIIATLTSMVYNSFCLKLMSKQPAYPKDSESSEILNDFSEMMRQPEIEQKLGKQTESGDISKLLAHIITIIIEQGELERTKSMSHKELYDFLSDSKNKVNKVFDDFLKRNGHRAFKEFCFSTKTWSDDCSYIIRSLSMRLKQRSEYESDASSGETKRQTEALEEHERRVQEIEAKFVNSRFLLTKFALPRARNATLRREQSKSSLIKTIHRYRLAFRHLGGLLCLLGRLPSVDLIYFLSIEEIGEIIEYKQFGSESSPHQDLPRLIYKARRRMQRAKVYQNIVFPKPNLTFLEMAASIDEQLAAQVNSTGKILPSLNGLAKSGETSNANGVLVKGMTSCAGKVTGRACVVKSPEEMDQLEPNDILITYSIDISWSVYFFTLAGIVTELGGIISHGAVVAREYGIPTLCTALGACSSFKTGQIVTLDADSGVCYLAASNSEEPKAQSSAEQD